MRTEAQRPWQAKIQLIVQIMVVITALSLPLSTTVTDLLFPLAAVLSLFTENLLTKIRKIVRNPVAVTLIAFFALYAVGVLYTIAPAQDVVRQLLKASCLLMAALLIPTLNDERWRTYAINAFLIAMVFVLILSYVKYFFVPTLFHTRFDLSSVFKDHIIQNYLMAFAAFFFAYRWLHKYSYRWAYGALFLFATFNILFMSGGRSGYFVFAALLFFTCAIHVGWKGLFYALASLIILGGLAFMLSPSFKDRMTLIAKNSEQYFQGHKTTSIGIRIQSIRNAVILLEQRPLFGHGTGSFYTAYSTLPHKYTYATGIMRDSYNNYLNVAVELGAVGLGLLLLMLFTQWSRSYRLPGELRYITQSLLIGMAIGCFANPWLSDTTELHLYTLFLSVGFAALPLSYSRKKKEIQTSDTPLTEPEPNQ